MALLLAVALAAAGCTDDGTDDAMATSSTATPAVETEATAEPAPSVADDEVPESTASVVLTLPESRVEVFDPSAVSGSRVNELAESVGARIDGDVAAITLEESVLFEFGSAELIEDGLPVLDDVAELLAELEAEEVSVIGHTDSVGGTDFNLDLSQRRADAVAEALVARGIASGLVQADGRGEAEPIAPNETGDGDDDPEGRARNRRVEIVAVGLADF